LKILKDSGGDAQDESQVHLLRLGEIYGSQGEFKKAEDAFSNLRRMLVPPGTGVSGPRVRNVISHLGWALFHQQKYREAEAVLRVDVSFYDRPTRPETEVRYNWEGVLGASLVAQNKNYEEAEYRLQSCYKGRLHPIGIGIPAGDVNLFSEQESVAWLVRLYDQWGKPDRATEWRAKLQTDKPAQSSKRSEASERFQ
jgi:tetratricopeptide (TPR) repeat protein